MASAERDSDWIKTEPIPVEGWFSKNLAQKPLICTRSCPEALKGKQTELLRLKTETGRGQSSGACTLDPHSLPSPADCRGMRSKKHWKSRKSSYTKVSHQLLPNKCDLEMIRICCIIVMIDYVLQYKKIYSVLITG